MKKLKLSRILKSIIVSLLIFSILFSIIYSVSVNKLNKAEYEYISSMYTRMRLVDSSIKNDFYVSFGLKNLDRSIVLSELKKDSLTYCLVVSDNIINLLSQGRDKAFVKSYLDRIEVDFDGVVGLEAADSLFEDFYMFISMYLPNEDYLGIFGSNMFEIIETEQNGIENNAVMYRTYICLISVSYLLIFIFVYLYIAEKINKKNFILLYNKVLSLREDKDGDSKKCK